MPQPGFVDLDEMELPRFRGQFEFRESSSFAVALLEVDG